MSRTRLAFKLVAAVALLGGAYLWLSSDFSPFSGGSDGGETTAAATGPIDRMSWLAGCWMHVESGFRRDEQWMAPLGGTMIGMSRSVAGGVTVEHEQLRVETRDGALVFTALPSGQAETAFVQAELSDSLAAFVAPEHDFPQRITYRHLDRNLAVATIEGEEEGITRSIDFPMTRTDCP